MCPACGGPLAEPGAACPACAAAAQTVGPAAADAAATRRSAPDRAVLPPDDAADTLRRSSPWTGAAPQPASVDAPTIFHSGPQPAGAPAALAPLLAATPGGSPFGRYRLHDRLGAGGMGVVWKAWDTQLQRTVALKQIRDDVGGAEALVRFEREARLAAKLRHPHIVPVYDVGVIDGRHFLTMDFVEGRPLSAALAETRAAKRAGRREGIDRLRVEIALLADVAGAVGYAHAEGVIHRDLKPGNVLLDVADRPYVMDFGLAKQVETPGATPDSAPALTVSGEALGTPLYMSPEQVAAEAAAIGPATDVWSLGVMLYETLAGATPFEGEGTPWAVMKAVTLDDPVPPRARNRHVPEELEAVCLKALEKDRARRYGTAAELERELRRWLAGEGVEARPPSTMRLLGRRVARHRLPLAAAGLAVAAIAVSGVFMAQAGKERDRADALVIEAMAPLREMARGCLEETLAARRRGDLETGARQQVVLERAWAAEQARPGGASAEAHFLLGRLHRALQRFREAAACQDQALARDPDFAPSLYESAILTARDWLDQYTREFERVATERAARGETADAAPPARAELEVRDAALAALRARLMELIDRCEAVLARRPEWVTHEIPLLRVGAAQQACLRALRALAGEAPSWERAQAQLDEALRLDPQREEAYDALYAAAYTFGRTEEAAAAAARGLERDQGYLDHALRLGNLAYLAGVRKQERGEDPTADYAAASGAVDKALKLRPDNAAALLLRGGVRMNLGQWRADHGGAPDAEFAAAQADLDAVLAAQPGWGQALVTRGMLHNNAARWRHRRGQDAEASFRAAIADYDGAAAQAPEDATILVRRANARNNWGAWLKDTGRNPVEHYLVALADLEKAVARAPNDPDAWSRTGDVCLNLGTWRQLKGETAAELYERGAAAYGKALERAPRSYPAWFRRGWIRYNWATELRGKKQDSVPTYEASEADYGQALELAPRSLEAWLGRANVRRMIGLARGEAGRDPGDAYDGSIADYDRALALAPDSADALAKRGRVRINRGQHRARAGEAATADFTAAIADLEAALRLAPSNAEYPQWLAVAKQEVGK